MLPWFTEGAAMLVSVILCTRNRADSLRRTLDSATRMRVPEGLVWEFLVIDNGSTDATAQVVADFADRLPIRRILEPTAGLSNARNCGIANAGGTYFCWTDDDVLIDENWLAAYVEAFRKYPDASVFGGVVEPVLEIEAPAWWLANKSWLSRIFAARDFGPDEMPLSHPGEVLPYGANFAVRGADQRGVPYDPELGVGPQHKRMGEETVVILALLDNGGTGYWTPGARVKHLIPARRISLKYVGEYYRSLGETWASLSTRDINTMGTPIPPGGRRINGMPVWLMRRAGVSWIKSASKRLMNASGDWMKAWTDYHYCAGALSFCRNQPR
jgi:glycosyltransferase involved in cell wall biosynthesis